MRPPSRWPMPALLPLAASLLVGCDEGLPLTWKQSPPPSIDSPAGFARLWGTNCAGCHGADGNLGPARPMHDPLYLASTSDAELTRLIAEGSPAGTLMPAFAMSRGGALSDAEITAIVSGMRRAWGDPAVAPSPLATAGSSTRGDPTRGRAIFERSCLACHASDRDAARTNDLGSPTAAAADARASMVADSTDAAAVPAGSVSDPFYLQLVSDRALRSAILFGRIDLGMPPASGPFPQRPAHEALTVQDVDDIVAWLSQRRTEEWPPKSVRRGGRP